MKQAVLKPHATYIFVFATPCTSAYIMEAVARQLHAMSPRRRLGGSCRKEEPSYGAGAVLLIKGCRELQQVGVKHRQAVPPASPALNVRQGITDASNPYKQKYRQTHCLRCHAGVLLS